MQDYWDIRKTNCFKRYVSDQAQRLIAQAYCPLTEEQLHNHKTLSKRHENYKGEWSIWFPYDYQPYALTERAIVEEVMGALEIDGYYGHLSVQVPNADDWIPLILQLHEHFETDQFFESYHYDSGIPDQVIQNLEESFFSAYPRVGELMDLPYRTDTTRWDNDLRHALDMVWDKRSNELWGTDSPSYTMGALISDIEEDSSHDPDLLEKLKAIEWLESEFGNDPNQILEYVIEEFFPLPRLPLSVRKEPVIWEWLLDQAPLTDWEWALQIVDILRYFDDYWSKLELGEVFDLEWILDAYNMALTDARWDFDALMMLYEWGK